MNNEKISRRINILRDSVSRRIAAGEVIDRPQAVVRELLDNSIDAGSTEINLYIRGGGIDEIRISDNGSGMYEEDLKLCFLPHATSKISEFEDIYSTKTLGFRGEALSSIASCSKLSITSAVSNNESANRLEVYDGKLRSLKPHQGAKGTTISVRDLFYSMPGRKNFLKSASAESAQCRSVFLDKALPHTDISFRYFVDDDLRLFLPAADLKTRVQSAYSGLLHNSMIQTLSSVSDNIKIRAAAGTPSLYRKDRKYIHVFINNRRISDYALVQAVDYAYSPYLPGGCHPVCFLFLDIPPEHVDFNIHPAKREVKFRNLPAIHHTVTEAIGNFLSRNNSFKADTKIFTSANSQGIHQNELGLIKNPPADGKKGFAPTPYIKAAISKSAENSIFRRESLDAISAETSPEFKSDSASAAASPAASSVNIDKPLIYLGQLFRLFLIFEYDKNLLIIDQHAAHERLIFNILSSPNPQMQELLVPLNFELERDPEKNLINSLDEYKSMGFKLQMVKEGEWLLNSMPAICEGLEDEIISFFKDGKKNVGELKKEIYAMKSCKSAIKDGDLVDPVTAIELASEVMKLENPRCPHGRPLIQLISRDQLFEMFGRTF